MARERYYPEHRLLVIYEKPRFYRLKEVAEGERTSTIKKRRVIFHETGHFVFMS